MLVLNDSRLRERQDTFVPLFRDSKRRTNDRRGRRRHGLNAANAAFLRSLGLVLSADHGRHPEFDERIVKIENHTYNPYANTTFGYSDEKRISIQQQDLYTLPCESFLYVEGTLRIDIASTQKEASSSSAVTLAKNCVAFMFDEIRYELDGVEIDKARNTGITSMLKNYVTMAYKKKWKMENAGWDLESSKNPYDFNFCVPLDAFLGFCEDYKRVVINARHELILIRAGNDNNCILALENAAEKTNVILTKIQWRMPHVMLNDVNKLSLLCTSENGRFLSMAFRS